MMLASFRAEALKMRRLWLPAIAIGSGLILLSLLWLSLNSAASRIATEKRMEAPWQAGVIGDAAVTMTLVLPTLAIIITALSFFVEHRSDMWKQLRASPQPMWTVYAAKLLVIQLLLALALIVALTAAFLAWNFLPDILQREIGRTGQVYRAMSAIAAALYLSILPLTLIQFFLSARMSNILHPVGIGLALTFANLMAMGPLTHAFLPYAYPGSVIMKRFAAPEATASAAMSEDPASPALSGSVADPRAVIGEVRELIANNYVAVENVAAIDAALRHGLASGRYQVADANILAQRVNEDLDASVRDKHLALSFNPARSRLLRTRPEETPAGRVIQERAAQKTNYGLVDMHLLHGNVRAVVVESFLWTGPASARALDNAMQFLAGSDAAIIDLRHNGGGSPEAVHYMISHFMEPGRPLLTFQMGRNGETRKFSTLSQLPIGRMVGKPLYVLTSGRTASAAEEFAAHVAAFKLGELVGETTAGAAFRNELFPVREGFVLSVSIGRPVLSATGSNWEGKGVTPSVKVSADDALEVAHFRALGRLAAIAPPAERARLEAAIAAARGRSRK